MSFPRYPKYKSSGVNELGDLPEHWDVKPLKHFAGIDSCGCYGVDAEEGEHVLPVATTAQIDADGRFVVPDMPMRGFTPAEIRRYGCGDGDILVVKSSGSATNIISGKAGLVTQDTPPFVFSNFLMRIRPTNGVANPRFIYSLLRSHLTRQRVEQMCSTTTYPNLKVSEYTSAPLPLPPVDEQTKIASFLDRETSKIDGLVGEQRRLIELLKEKRQAVISHAVTKGLNPHAPLKPSGIEWLGDVPTHWEVLKGSLIGTLFGSEQVPEESVCDEGDLPFIKVGSMSLDSFAIESWDWFVDRAVAAQYKPRSGYIVFPKRGAAIFTNKVNIVERPSLIDPNLMGWEIGDKASPKFIAYTLKSRKLDELADVSTVPQINNKHIAPERFPIPPLDEQEAIVAFIDAETAKLDALTVEAERGIKLLQERRTALISAAVTGQIDVRGLVATEAA